MEYSTGIEQSVNVERYIAAEPLFDLNSHYKFVLATSDAKKDELPKPVQDLAVTKRKEYNRIRAEGEEEIYLHLDTMIGEGIALHGYSWERWEEEDLQQRISETIKITGNERVPTAVAYQHQVEVMEESKQRKAEFGQYLRSHPIDALHYFSRRKAYVQSQLNQKGGVDAVARQKLNSEYAFCELEENFITTFLKQEPHARCIDYLKRQRTSIKAQVDHEQGADKMVAEHFLAAIDEKISFHEDGIQHSGIPNQVMSEFTMGKSHGPDERTFTSLKGRPN